MSSYQDHLWCDVVDMDLADILLSMPWLYYMNVTSFGGQTLVNLRLLEKE